jgi:hypothetical protein
MADGVVDVGSVGAESFVGSSRIISTVGVVVGEIGVLAGSIVAGVKEAEGKGEGAAVFAAGWNGVVVALVEEMGAICGCITQLLKTSTDTSRRITGEYLFSHFIFGWI